MEQYDLETAFLATECFKESLTVFKTMFDNNEKKRFDYFAALSE
jgi:hypothetical protein